MQKSSARVLVNVCLFQAGWWACVLGAAHGYAWLGVMAVAVIAVIHLCFVSVQRRLDLLLGVCALLLGMIGDTAAAAAGAFDAGQLAWAGPLAPPFMLALWVNFALTLTTTLRWVQSRYVLAAVLGAVSGPLAYYAGARLGALTLGPRGLFTALLIIAAEWLVALPALLLLWQLLETRMAGRAA